MDLCIKKLFLRQREMRTGCHCAMKPKGRASKPGQEQQLTRTAHKECLRLAYTGAQLSTVVRLTCTFTSAATVSPPTHTLYAVLLLCKCVSWKPWRRTLKRFALFTLYLVILCDRCFLLGWQELKHFIKVCDSVKCYITEDTDA